MNKTNVVPMAKARRSRNPKIVTVTPEEALSLLDFNNENRPLTDAHVRRIANQIKEGKWRFNGDTIKIADDGSVVDGQHRLWAIVEAKIAVETIVVYGIARDAFATIDTLSKARSGADILTLRGLTHHRKNVSTALSWLVRHQRGAFTTGIRRPDNRVEISDIEQAFANHPHIVDAVEKCRRLNSVVSVAVISFVYYIAYSANPDLADRMINTLSDPAGAKTTDPFFVLRAWLLNQKSSDKKVDPLNSVAHIYKALNAAHAERDINNLIWRNQGKAAEPFPTLNI